MNLLSQVANFSHPPPKSTFITYTKSNNSTDGFVPVRQHRALSLNKNPTSKHKKRTTQSQPLGNAVHQVTFHTAEMPNTRSTRLRWHWLNVRAAWITVHCYAVEASVQIRSSYTGVCGRSAELETSAVISLIPHDDDFHLSWQDDPSSHAAW